MTFDYGSDDWPALPPMSALENRVHVADIFDLCAMLPDASVDMILCDLPYGVTNCSWDTVIPFGPMWAAFQRIAKPRAAIVLTASQPFTSALVMSNPRMYHQALIWEKQHPKNFLNARRMHLLSHEDVIVFCDGLPVYNPQGLTPVTVKSGRKNKGGNGVYNRVGATNYTQTEGNFPRSVLKFDAMTNDLQHPTQKPVALFEYLIRTYTQPGELVFDPCVGSGTTAVAARNTGRRFIVGDQSPEYAAIARRRIAEPFTPNMFDTLEHTA